MSPRGLGRGLSALIPSAGAPVPQPSVRPYTPTAGVLVVPPEQIAPNPMQPRREFPPEELAALSASIRTHGVLQPLVVTRRADGSYELVAGERRLRAAKLAGLATVPIVVRDGMVDERTKLELAVIENIQRQDLNPIDRAAAYRELADAFAMTQEDIAERIGVSRSAVAHALRLLALPDDMQVALRAGKLSEGHAKVLVGMSDPKEQRAWFARILAGGVSVAAAADGTKSARRQRLVVRHDRSSQESDPNLRAKALALQQALGARVRIAPNGGGGGAITIEYGDAEELSGIVRRISKHV